MTMVCSMKKIGFVSILAAMALLLSGLYGPSPVSGVETTTPPATCSSSTTSAVVCAEPATPTPRSPGRNSNLTIDLLPQRGVSWEECTFSSQRYCYEAPTLVGIDGIEVSSPMTPFTNCHNNDFSSTELCSVDGSDWFEVGLSGNFSETDLQNTYRWKLRTGKLSPDIMMMGDTQKSVIGGNATDGWTIEIWAKPALKAYLNGCYTASTCPDTSVASSVSYSLSGYIRTLGIEADERLRRWPSVGTEALRSALRGTFISTNGMSQSWTFSNDTFSATAVSPHFLPPDSTGKSDVTPGYVKIFLPETYLTLDRGYKDLSLVTSDRIKLTVSGQNATAKVTRVDGGILVDTGVEHFSAPNPEMSVLKANGAATSVVTGTTPTSVVMETTPTPFLAKLKKGSSKTLSSIAKTKASQKPKWTASGKCKIIESKLVAFKLDGTCKVTLRVLNSKKKYVVQTRKTFEVF